MDSLGTPTKAAGPHAQDHGRPSYTRTRSAWPPCSGPPAEVASNRKRSMTPRRQSANRSVVVKRAVQSRLAHGPRIGLEHKPCGRDRPSEQDNVEPVPMPQLQPLIFERVQHSPRALKREEQRGEQQDPRLQGRSIWRCAPRNRPGTAISPSGHAPDAPGHGDLKPGSATGRSRSTCRWSAPQAPSVPWREASAC